MFQASQNRRWITREEIAEIHEQRATIQKRIRDDATRPPGERSEAYWKITKIDRQARDTRAAELLSNPIGARTA